MNASIPYINKQMTSADKLLKEKQFDENRDINKSSSVSNTHTFHTSLHTYPIIKF